MTWQHRASAEVVPNDTVTPGPKCDLSKILSVSCGTCAFSIFTPPRLLFLQPRKPSNKTITYSGSELFGLIQLSVHSTRLARSSCIIIPGLIDPAWTAVVLSCTCDLKASGDDAHPAKSLLSFLLVVVGRLKGFFLHVKARAGLHSNEQLCLRVSKCSTLLV